MEEEEEEEEDEGITRRRTKPALRCSPTSLRTHRSARIRRAENHEKETRASLARTRRAGPNPKSRPPQVKFRLLVSSIGPSDDDNYVMGKKIVRRDGNVSRPGMSFPLVPLTLPLEPLTWCGGAPLPSRNCLPLPLLHHLPPFPSRLPFLLSPSSFPLFSSFFFNCSPFSLFSSFSVLSSSFYLFFLPSIFLISEFDYLFCPSPRG